MQQAKPSFEYFDVALAREVKTDKPWIFEFNNEILAKDFNRIKAVKDGMNKLCSDDKLKTILNTCPRPDTLYLYSEGSDKGIPLHFDFEI